MCRLSRRNLCKCSDCSEVLLGSGCIIFGRHILRDFCRTALSKIGSLGRASLTQVTSRLSSHWRWLNQCIGCGHSLPQVRISGDLLKYRWSKSASGRCWVLLGNSALRQCLAQADASPYRNVNRWLRN